ncbi:MAG: hypothetical protein Q9218_005984 [Villophora microphyllina]
MSFKVIEASALHPVSITLSMLHLSLKASDLPTQTGVYVSLSQTNPVATSGFKAIIQDTTTHSLVLSSFYASHIAGENIDGVYYPRFCLECSGVSSLVVSTTLGQLMDEDPHQDRTAPDLQPSGMCHVPVCHQGYKFTPACFIVEHLFGCQEYEKDTVMILGQDFLKEYFIRAQWCDGGWVIDSACFPHALDELVVYTDGCCLSNGQSGQNMARAGYGIHFPQLPRDWDLKSPLSETEKHTNQRAELTAVIRASQLVRMRGVPCERIHLYADSMYAVKGLAEWIPHWRNNGYRTAQKKPVANADLFKMLDQEASQWMNQGGELVLDYIPREQNSIADGLAKAGAQQSLGTPELTISGQRTADLPLVTGLNGQLFNMTKPLVQWTPDGHHWVKYFGESN